jgi:hypothetical protein
MAQIGRGSVLLRPPFVQLDWIAQPKRMSAWQSHPPSAPMKMGERHHFIRENAVLAPFLPYDTNIFHEGYSQKAMTIFERTNGEHIF